MRKVIYAKLQGTDAFIPGVGGLGTTLPPLNKTYNLQMFDAGDKLVLKVNGVEAFIPMTNVQIGIYAPEKTEDSK